MMWSQFSIVWVQAVIFTNVGNVCAVGRGLRPLSPTSRNPSVVDQGLFPSQIEEQEEDDGTEQQEMDAPQPQHQENNLQVLVGIPAQSVVGSTDAIKFSSSQDYPAAPNIATPGLKGAEPTEPAPSVVAASVVEALSLASVQKPPAQPLPISSRPHGGPTTPSFGGTSASFPHAPVVGGSFFAGPGNSFEAVNDNKYSTCNPPCKQGRGVCNDNMCFCKSPFVGTTCQHKVGAYSRAPFPMMIGFAIVSFVMGGLGAQIVHAVSVRAVEGRTGWLHSTATKQEVWRPPGAGKTLVPKGHPVQEQKVVDESGD